MQRIVPGHHAPAIAACLRHLAGEGFAPRSLAATLELLAAERERQAMGATDVDEIELDP